MPEGQAVNLSCTVTGGRGVNVSWLLHGREAPGTMTTQLVQLYVVSTLRLDAVTTAHNGEFECVARESGGERSSATITLTVIPRSKHAMHLSLKTRYYYIYIWIVYMHADVNVVGSISPT